MAPETKQRRWMLFISVGKVLSHPVRVQWEWKTVLQSRWQTAVRHCGLMRNFTFRQQSASTCWLL